MPCTRHRVFLATLIVAAKYLNDSSPKNKNWVNYARLFELPEVNLMEKQLLYLLNYDLRFDEEEALRHFASFLPESSTKATEAPAPEVSCTESSAKETRAAAVNRAKARVQAHISVPPTNDGSASLPSPAGSNSGVQGFVKRISSQYLGVPTAEESRPPMLSRASSSSTLSSRSHSSESESGYTYDSGSSSPSSLASSDDAASVNSYEVDIEDITVTEDSEVKPSRISLSSASYAYKHGQGRKVSTASTCTIKSDGTVAGTVSDLKRVAIADIPSPGRSDSSDSSSPSSPSQGVNEVLLRERRGVGRGAARLTHARDGSHSLVVPSATMPVIAKSTGTGGFLSRMWAATKGQASDKDAADQDGPSNAFRRLAHSKSALFRSQQQQQQQVDAV